MGLLDRFRKTAKSAVDKNPDAVDQGIDKAAEAADEKTGGQHTDKIDAGAEQAKDAVDKL